MHDDNSITKLFERNTIYNSTINSSEKIVEKLTKCPACKGSLTFFYQTNFKKNITIEYTKCGICHYKPLGSSHPLQ